MPSHPRIHPIYICIYVVIVHLPLPVLLVIFSPLRYSCAASCVENKQSDRPDIRRMTEKKLPVFSTFSTDMRRRTTVRIVGFRSQVYCNPPFPHSKQLPLNPSFLLQFGMSPDIYKCVCNQLLHFFDEFVKINGNFRSYTNIMILLIQFVFISNEVYYDFLITQGCYANFQKRVIANLFTFQVC